VEGAQQQGAGAVGQGAGAAGPGAGAVGPGAGVLVGQGQRLLEQWEAEQVLGGLEARGPSER